MTLDYLTIETSSPAGAAVIWLHGLGASADDFYNLPEQLTLPNSLAIRFIFPQAPLLRVTINNGYVMPAWYDIRGLDKKSREDEAGLHRSQAALNELIEIQIQDGIPPERIILAGFSQGGAVSLFCGLRYPKTLGGIIALSSYLALASNLKAEVNTANRHIPIFMAHGQYDTVVSAEWAALSCAKLEKLGAKVSWHLFTMEHQVCPEELKAIRGWLIERLR